MRLQFMAANYDKALKRKDYSGIMDKDNSKGASDGDKNEIQRRAPRPKLKADDPKAGADVEKIVNLIAGDANRVLMTASAMYFIYGSVFLHSPFFLRLIRLIDAFRAQSLSRVPYFISKVIQTRIQHMLETAVGYSGGLHSRDSSYSCSGGR